MFNNEKVRGLKNKLNLLSENDDFLKDYMVELENRINRIARIQRYGEKDGATINIMPQVPSSSKDYCAWNADLALYINDNEYIFKNFFVGNETDLMIDKNYYILECSKNIFAITLYSNKKGYLSYVLNIGENTFMKTDVATFNDYGNLKATRKTMKE